MTAFCWWVLGANIVELPALGRARAVVPSKIGYVGLWQWDAYFIAVGLRHGDPELAREQLRARVPVPERRRAAARRRARARRPRHERRPAAGRPGEPAPCRLARSPTPRRPFRSPSRRSRRGRSRKVLEAEPADDWAREQLAVIRRSQDWWFAGIRPRPRRHAGVRASVLLRPRRQPDLRRPAADDGARPRGVPRAAGPRARPLRGAPRRCGRRGASSRAPSARSSGCSSMWDDERGHVPRPRGRHGGRERHGRGTHAAAHRAAAGARRRPPRGRARRTRDGSARPGRCRPWPSPIPTSRPSACGAAPSG